MVLPKISQFIHNSVVSTTMVYYINGKMVINLIWYICFSLGEMVVKHHSPTAFYSVVYFSRLWKELNPT
jgi:hypothetical protein